MPNNFINNYFAFNKQQRNGLYALVCISFFLLVVRVLYPVFITPDNIVIKDLPLIKSQLDSSYDQRVAAYNTPYQKIDKSSSLFQFDPNTVKPEELLQLGFSEKTAAIFIKYRNKGIRFNDKADLKKVFGVSDRLYTKLEPYIVIPEKKAQDENIKMIVPVEMNSSKSQQNTKVDINSADSVELMSISGIGAGYAKRILKYRTLLGGFQDVSQLKEVYGFSDELYKKILPFVFVGAFDLQKINLNKDDFKTINKHPYLSYEQTKTIFEWRRKTNITPTNLPDILNDSAVCRKLLPYLRFD